MQTNNVISLVSLNALHADEIEKKTETSKNPIIVKKEPVTGSLFPICTFEILVIYTQKKEQGISSRFPIPCSRSTVLKYPRRLLK